jgi:hypothetical protein
MHVCEDFREKITEQIIDRRDLDNDAEVQRELLVCNSCADFYAESRDLIEAMSTVRFEVEDVQWEAMADRMRVKILEAHAAQARSSWFERLGISRWSLRPYVPAFAGLAAMVLIVVSISRMTTSLILEAPQVPTQPLVSHTQVIGDPNPTLDPVTVEFLEQSELLLRTVMNLPANSTDDLHDAQKAASRQLIGLDQRKEAAAEVPPAVKIMDKYELILRELKNIDMATAAEDLTDIRKRIEKNGLIAGIKALQPKVSEVESGFDHEQ